MRDPRSSSFGKGVDNVKSSVEIEVSKYQLATNLAIWDSDSDLHMDNIIFNSAKYFCCSFSYFHKSLAVFYFLYAVPFSDYLKDHNYLKVILTDSSHIFGYLPLLFTIKTRSILCYCHEQDIY